MESLIALGFAANVIQLADFTARVMSRTYKIYRARPNDREPLGNTTNSAEIEMKLQTFTNMINFDDDVRAYLQEKSLTTKLRERGLPPDEAQRHTTLNVKTTKCLSQCDKQIIEVCLRCEDLALDLRQAIAKLKGPTKPTLWSSFAEALRTLGGEGKFRDLSEQMQGYREQMIVLLLVSLREKVSSQKSNHEDLYDATRQIRLKLKNLLSSQEQTKAEIIQAIREEHQQASESDRHQAPSQHLQREMMPVGKVLFDKKILHWVRFAEVDMRYDKIDRAYEKTFEWAFRPPPDDEWPDFTLWLKGEVEPLYWITGKPASGKSTLLKFIHSDERTLAHLNSWAGDRTLVTCAFYFWNSAEPIQMSEEGMLRTILHNALQQAPELWAVVFPSKMEEYILFSDPFERPITAEEIETAFQLLLRGAGTTYRLFLFLDGLDECGEDQGRLVKMIKRFISPHIKTCVSSRDWPIFDDAFQGRPRLRLETLTHVDIKQYVVSRFAECPAYRERQLGVPAEIEALMDSITTRASGVFLWVRLVTDSLILGLEFGERIEELQARLDELPLNLEELFWKILTKGQIEHRIHMSQLLQIMRCPQAPLTLIDFFHADELSPEIVSKTPYGAPDPIRTEACALTMHRRLRVCCKCFLQAEQPKGAPLATAVVTYLHRTVKDYLDRPDIWSRFLDITNDDFLPHLRMYNAYAIQVKMMFQDDEAFNSNFWSATLLAVDHIARAYPENDGGRQLTLLKQLDSVATHVVGSRVSNGKHWSSLRKGSRINSSCLHLAIQLQLSECIPDLLEATKASTSNAADLQSEVTTCLLMATLYHDSFAKDTSVCEMRIVPKAPSLELITLFLEQGADPNSRIPNALKEYGNIPGDYSVWEVHLREPTRDSASWIAMSMLFLEHSADPALVTGSNVAIPREVMALAEQKARERREEMKRSRSMSKSFRSIFGIKKQRGLLKMSSIVS